jgi:ketosteroid isomerase-like protein
VTRSGRRRLWGAAHDRPARPQRLSQEARGNLAKAFSPYWLFSEIGKMRDAKSVLEGLTREQYLAIARDIYGRRARGDNEPILSFFADNATYRLIGSRDLIPAAGVRIGKDEIREAWRAFDIDFEIVRLDVDDMVFEMPSRSYVSWHMTLKNRGTGAIVELEGVDRLRWEDFRIVDSTSYFDTALLAALRQGE